MNKSPIQYEIHDEEWQGNGTKHKKKKTLSGNKNKTSGLEGKTSSNDVMANNENNANVNEKDKDSNPEE